MGIDRVRAFYPRFNLLVPGWITTGVKLGFAETASSSLHRHCTHVSLGRDKCPYDMLGKMGETNARKRALGLKKTCIWCRMNCEWAQDVACADSYVYCWFGLYHGNDFFTEILDCNSQGWGLHLVSTIVIPLSGFCLVLHSPAMLPPLLGWTPEQIGSPSPLYRMIFPVKY